MGSRYFRALNLITDDGWRRRRDHMCGEYESMEQSSYITTANHKGSSIGERTS